MSIVVISDDKDFANQVASKLVFLREDDSINISGYDNAIYSAQNVKIAVVCENVSKNATLELIEKLRENKDLCIILLASSYDRNFILSAYDAGIDDFAQSSADDFELVIRIVNNLKHNSVKRSLSKKEKLLEQIKVVDETTGFYNYKLAKLIFENAISDAKNPVFMALSPSNSFKPSFSSEKMSKAIKSSTRYDDLISLGNGGVFYVMLSNTDINGALVVLNKIKENYGKDFELSAGVVEVLTDSFEQIEKEALNALSNALATNAEFVIVNNETETVDEWLDQNELQNKNYKIFKQMFNKKLEKVIAPVFYSLQNTWEEKLFNTEIEQYTNNEQCVFALKNKKQNSTLRIIYPGFSKILLTITHEGLDSPENRELQLPLSKITQKDLIKIIEDFIKEFKSSL